MLNIDLMNLQGPTVVFNDLSVLQEFVYFIILESPATSLDTGAAMNVTLVTEIFSDLYFVPGFNPVATDLFTSKETTYDIGNPSTDLRMISALRQWRLSPRVLNYYL